MKETLEDLIDRYRLSKEEHNQVLEHLKTSLFVNKNTTEIPSIMFVVGQPGVGKTTFIQNLRLSDYLLINSDDFRHLHKYSEEILFKYPIYYAKLTNFDAHLWGDELFSDAIQKGYSVLREKAPTDYSLLKLLKTISQNYEVIVNVVVEGNLESLLRTRERYEKEVLMNHNAKLSNIEAHNKCYNLLPDFISECLSIGVTVNYVVREEQHFKIISVKENTAIKLLESLRNESNTKAVLGYEERIRNIKDLMLNRHAPEEQFIELKKIEDIYFEMTNVDNKKLPKK